MPGKLQILELLRHVRVDLPVDDTRTCRRTCSACITSLGLSPRMGAICAASPEGSVT